MSKRSPGEEALAAQLEQAGIDFWREVRFAPPRRWRFDFVVGDPVDDLAVEVEGGHWVGGHGRARFEKDCEKYNAAALMGYRVLRFTTKQAEDGTAIAAIREAVKT